MGGSGLGVLTLGTTEEEGRGRATREEDADEADEPDTVLWRLRATGGFGRDYSTRTQKNRKPLNSGVSRRGDLGPVRSGIEQKRKNVPPAPTTLRRAVGQTCEQ